MQEVVRRMRNCDRETELEEVGVILDKFCQKMKDSGYEQKMRREVVDAGVKIYREQVRKDEIGERPLYRRRNGDKEQKEKAKKEKRNFWRRKKDKDGGEGEEEQGMIRMPIMVPYTVSGGLVKKFKERAKSCGVEAVFIERTGYSLQNQLEKADPFRGEDCGMRQCFPCEEGGGGGDCEKRGAGYEIVCGECTEKVARYDGQSGRNCFIRGIEHKKGYSGKKVGNPMWEHDKEFHGGGGDTGFKMKVKKVYGRDNVRRMVNEAVRIERNEGVVMNGRAEHRRSCLPRVVVHRNTID